MGKFDWPPPETAKTDTPAINTGAYTPVSKLKEKFLASDGGTPLGAPAMLATGANTPVSELKERFEDPALAGTRIAPLIPPPPPPPTTKVSDSESLDIPTAPPAPLMKSIPETPELATDKEELPDAPPPPPGMAHVDPVVAKPVTGMAPKQQLVGTPKFGKEFESSSIGVENELGGFVCALPANADRAFAFVRMKGTSEPLVMITKDMSTGAYGNPAKRDFVKEKEHWKTHMLELVTYPAAMNDAVAIGHRNAAVRFLLSTFKSRLGSNNHEPLVNMTSPEGNYELVVSNGSHVLAAANGVALEAQATVSLGGQQATVGVKAKDFGDGGSPELELLEGATWYHKDYQAEIATQLATATSAGDCGKVYAYMKSILAQTAKLVKDFSLPLGSYDPGVPSSVTGLTDPVVKNQWGILPRTKPTVMLDTLEGTDRQLVKKLLFASAPVGDPTIWAAVREYIMTSGGEIAGHGINDAKVGGEQALLFEYRTVPEQMKSMMPTIETGKTTDPFAGVKAPRATVLKGVNAYAADHLDEMKAWFDNQDEKWKTRSPQTILKQAAANQLAWWVKTTQPDVWSTLTTPVLAPPPPVMDGTFDYAL